MKKIYFLLILVSLVFLLSGYVDLDDARGVGTKMLLCRRTIAGIIDLNKRNLSKLDLGMPKGEVLEIMQTKPLIAYQKGQAIEVTNPYRTETLRGKEKEIEVLYYVTEAEGQDYTITDEKLTPLVFENNKLIGWGWSFLQDIVKKYEIEQK